MKKSFHWVALLSIATLTACNSQSEEPQKAAETPVSHRVPTIKRLAPNTKDLSAADAEIVANLFSKKKAKTRAVTTGEIQEVITIPDTDGNPAVYAVNYEDGYILVSATTNFYPILAEVEHGTFSMEAMQSIGESVLVNEYIEQIEQVKDLPPTEDININSQWISYIGNKIQTRGYAPVKDFPEYSDYGSAVDQFTDFYYPEIEYTLRLLKDCKNTLPSDIYNEFLEASQSEDLWEGTEYCAENTAYVLIFDPGSDGLMNGPLLKTTWDQYYPYNTTNFNALGCVTVAVGQLMKYYQKPSYFKWSEMPDNDGNDVLRIFLGRMRSELGIDENGAGSNEKALEVLKSYGYKCELIPHNFSKICSSVIFGNNPIYAYGADRSKGSAHAWVIDGGINTDHYKEYTLYRLSDVSYPNFRYVVAENAEQHRVYYRYGQYFFHMNWGWGGTHNGWFLDTNIGNPVGNYGDNRKEIFITR